METMMGDVLSTVAQFDPWRHTGPWESTKPNINTPRLGQGHLGTQSKGLFLSWLWDYLFFHKLFHIYRMRLFIFTFKLMFADYNENEFYLQVDFKYWPCLSISVDLRTDDGPSLLHARVSDNSDRVGVQWDRDLYVSCLYGAPCVSI